MFKKTTRIKEINSANFDQAVIYTKKLRERIISHIRIRSIALPIGCVLFFVTSLFITFGFVSSTFSVYNAFFTEKAPFVIELWTGFITIIDRIADTWYWQTLICIGILFIVPFVSFLLVATIIRLLTSAPSPALSGSHKEQVDALHEYCRQIRCSTKQDWKLHAVWARLVTFSFLAVLVAYEICAIIDGDGTMTFVWLSVPLYFLYGLFINLFLRLTWICYRDKNEDYYSISSSRYTHFMLVITQYKEKLEAPYKKDPKTILLENYRQYGHNDYIKEFVADFDKRLKVRKDKRGDYISYTDLWDEAKWLYEINHPEAKKYEAIVCYCAHTDYKCSKYEQEIAFKRFCELGMSYKLADGYCRNYFMYTEPEVPNPDPLGMGDGVPVDGRGI